jgi:hypothetical protein
MRRLRETAGIAVDARGVGWTSRRGLIDPI